MRTRVGFLLTALLAGPAAAMDIGPWRAAMAHGP
jgi:hypothetical protein